MFKMLVQEFLSLTPFISPTMDRFYSGADKEGFMSRIPLFSSILSFIPPLKWVDSKFKYPLLTIGRVFLSLFIVLTLINFTNENQHYKEFTSHNITNQIIKEPELEVVPDFKVTNPLEMGTNLSKNLSASITNNVKKTQNQLSRNTLNGIISGPAGVLVRAPIFYLIYSLLFFIFGNTISQREQKALSKISRLRQIGENFINNISQYITQEKLDLINNEFSTLTSKQKLYNSKYQEKILNILQNK
jgi:hypothetical protein